jgi:hypothetical protein
MSRATKIKQYETESFFAVTFLTTLFFLSSCNNASTSKQSADNCDKFVGKWEREGGNIFIGYLTIIKEGENFIVSTDNGKRLLSKCEGDFLNANSKDHDNVSYSKERDHVFFFDSEWHRVK